MKRLLSFFFYVLFFSKIFSPIFAIEMPPIPPAETTPSTEAAEMPIPPVEETPVSPDPETLSPPAEEIPVSPDPETLSPPAEEIPASTPPVVEKSALPAMPGMESPPMAEGVPPAEAISPADAPGDALNETPAVTPTPEVKFEQPTWPQALELSEKGKPLSQAVWKQGEKFRREAKMINEKIQKVIMQIRKLREDHLNKYKDADNKLDVFFQEVGFVQGRLQKTTSSLPPEIPTPVAVPGPAILQQELDQLRSEVEAIDKLESDVLTQLSELDTKVDSAIDESVNARKVGVEMTRATEEISAKANLDKLKASLKRVEEIKNSLQSDFSNKFNNALNQIQSQSQSVREKVKNLEAKGLKMEEIVPSVSVEQIENTEEIIEKKIPKKKIAETYWFKTGVSIVAGTINVAKKIGVGIISFLKNTASWFAKVFKEGVTKSKQEAISPLSPGGPEVPPAKPEISEKQPLPGMPTSPKVTPTVPDNVLKQVQGQMQDLEQSVKKLEKEKSKIEQKRQKLEQVKKQRMEQIRKRLQLMEQVGMEKGLTAAALKGLEATQKPKWRQVVEYVFGKLLDVISFAWQKIKLYSVRFYQNFLKEKISNFSAAVTKRVKQLEKE